MGTQRESAGLSKNLFGRDCRVSHCKEWAGMEQTENKIITYVPRFECYIWWRLFWDSRASQNKWNKGIAKSKECTVS